MSFWFRQLFGVFNFIANVVAIATVAPPSSLFKNIIEPVCSKKKKWTFNWRQFLHDN
jgi:hypothetical protein